MHKKIIAVVDDDESTREAVETLVRSLGYQSQTFANAEEFLRCANAERIACLVADLQMPGLSGIELRRRLVALGKPIPTLLITAHPDDRSRTLAFRAGITCYLVKPFSDNELIECLQRALAPGS